MIVMDLMIVETVTTKAAATELDELLWRTLWQPLGLHRDVRREFIVEGKEIELIITLNGQIAGGLVAVWTSDAEIELRHLAVASNAQRRGVGRTLVAALLGIASSRKCQKICAIARSTSADFFRKLGFQTASGTPPEHPVFIKHGITFERMEIIVEPCH